MAVVLFATEWVSVDLIGLLIMASLAVTGVVSTEQALDGFSNDATITVAFMFIISAALMKTGALQTLAHRLSSYYRSNFGLGVLLLMVLVAFVSAFINNTPVVAVFIPVVIQLAHASGQPASKLLIPLSYSSILGGTCSLLGTSTNLLVSGIVVESGLPGLNLFTMAPLGLMFLALGLIFMMLLGIRLLPNRRSLSEQGEMYNLREFITEIELMPNHPAVNRRIMDADFVKELGMEIIEVYRNGSIFPLPPGDFTLKPHDKLKVNCDQEKLFQLKDRVKINRQPTVKIGETDLKSKNTTLVELIVTSDSEVENKTLREIDFRRRYRSAPLAIQHREEIAHNHLYELKLRAGDVIMAEVKSHYVEELKKPNSPFMIVSENTVDDFQIKKLYKVLAVILGIVLLSTFQVVPMVVAVIGGVTLLALLRVIEMKEAYRAINWKIIFLLAGALSLGKAMQNSGLDQSIAHVLIHNLRSLGPLAILSGMYLLTSLLTEAMSNNATAALMTPIAIATAYELEVHYLPFVMAVMFASSASFMTPVGYQTNTMVYSAGKYRFLDFVRVGSLLNLMFWLLATLMLTVIYPF